MTASDSGLCSSSAALFEAVRTGDSRLLNANVKTVEDLAVCENITGQTPLHVAAAVGEATMGAYLVELGADPNVQDAQGDTPLHLAAKHKHRLVASMLMWGGANAELVNSLKNTPLHEAVLADSWEIAYIIVENGGESTAKLSNADGLTPLDIAKARANAAVLEVLQNAAA